MMLWTLVVIVPVLCMGLLAQEWANGTVETLFTAPVGETDVVLGKWLGSLGFFVLLLLPTLIYVALLKMYSQVDLGPVFTGYLGLFLVGAMFLAIGLFCSSLTRSQVIAAVSAVAILSLITVAPFLMAANLSELHPVLRKLTEWGVQSRYADFGKGVIDTGHLVFFAVITAVFLFLTVKVLESRRWK